MEKDVRNMRDYDVISKRKEVIYLVVGATGRIGQFIVKSLIEKGKKVRVFSEGKKFSGAFTEEEIEKLEIGDYKLESLEKKEDSILGIFSSNEDQEICVISAVNYLSEEKSSEEHLKINKRLIDGSVSSGKVKKFALLSSTHVTRPYSFCSLYSNLKFNYSLYHKVAAEDYLRKSGLNYLIIRPNKLKFDPEPSSFTISQGDRTEGEISVSTLGRLVADAANDPWISANTSFECFTTPEQFKQPYHYTQGLILLKSETSLQKRLPNHKLATRLVLTSVWSVILTLAYLTYRVGKNQSAWERFLNHIRGLFGKKVKA